MAPAYERAAAELEPDFRLLKVNADEAQRKRCGGDGCDLS
jgi:hypothetical protein